MTIESRILQPVGVSTFLAEYWEQQPLHISRALTNLFADVLNEKMLFDELAKKPLSFPTVQLTQSDRLISPDAYTDENRKLLPASAIQLYSEGATLVWSQAHEWFSGLNALCRELQSALKLPCLANVYLSPARQQGFNAHYDSHDVMIVQVSGKKVFRFFENGMTLPFANERFDSSVHSAGKQKEEIELKPGDTLYIPRGMMHDAVATGKEVSLHITVGVYTITYKDLLQQQFELMSRSNIGLRRSIDSLIERSDTLTALPPDILSTARIDTDLISEAFEQLKDGLALDSLTDPLLQTISETATAQLSESSQLLIKHENVMDLSREGDTVKLRLFGKILHFNDPMGAAIQWMLAQKSGKFACQSIPSLSREQRLALCKQLILVNVVDLVV